MLAWRTMRGRLTFFILALALMAMAVTGWIGWWKDHCRLKNLAFTSQRLVFVEAENKRLQGLLETQQRETDASYAHNARQELEHIVVNLRAMPFLKPVAYREIPRSELPTILRQKLSQQVPDQEFDRTSVAFAALGLVPKGLDLKKTYLGLLGEQVGAFYDQHSRELFTFSGQSLANSQNRVIMAHELTHALEDQHFHLEQLPLEAKGNDDRALAASALVEGDATLVMNRYLLGNVTADVVRESLAATVTTDVRQLARAPRFLRETLLFPYLKGQEFCQVLYERGGWAELARAFEQPPSSTAQILHPDRFLTLPREEPISIDFPATDVLNQRPISDNVLGEFGLRQLLAVWLKSDQQAVEMASGWRGDRYLVYGDAAASSYALEIAWRSAGEAESFASAVAAAKGTNGQSAKADGPTFVVTINAKQQRTLIVSGQNIQWHAALKTCFANAFIERTPVPGSQP